MQLKKEILKKLDNRPARLRLALALNLSEQSIVMYIKENHENLTKAAALKVIREITGLTDILNESKEAVS